MLENIDKLHTTPMGRERIKRNLNLGTEDVVLWCKTAITTAAKSTLVLHWKKGKNWYIHTPDICITVNGGNFCIITAHKLKTKVRPMVKLDYPVLREFLYQAIYVPSGEELPPRDILDNHNINQYIQDFGKQAGDLGVVAERGGQIVGAAWTRIILSYGHIDDNTPELAISCLPEYRGKGIGTKLMNALFKLLKANGYQQTSLSVQASNPATRLYLKLGYQIIAERPDGHGHFDYLMIKKLT